MAPPLVFPPSLSPCIAFSNTDQAPPAWGSRKQAFSTSLSIVCRTRKWAFREASGKCGGKGGRKRGYCVQRAIVSWQSTALGAVYEIGNARIGQTMSRVADSYGPHGSGYLKVSDVHTIYFEIHGNPMGKPAVFLHGGPGAGCFARHAKFFDPLHYRVVLFDQRGCGNSSPHGCLDANTTWDLVEDIEKLRNHLGVNKWMVMGGSWGVTLALAYIQTYPNAVSALILRGVCLMRREEIDWFYKQGANYLFPFAWEQLLSVLEPSEQHLVLPAFYKRLTSNDTQVQFQAAQAWLRWEMSLSFFSAPPTVYYWDGRQYLMEAYRQGTGEKQEPTSAKETMECLPSLKGSASGAWSENTSKMVPIPQGGVQRSFQASTSIDNSTMPSQVVQARLECHYFLHKGFLMENQLLERISMVRHIPCVIIHGRHDFVCPLKNAFDLHRAWPEAELCIVCNAGHSMYEKGISHELFAATTRFKSLQY
eukprot:c26158_g1_i1 orf=88-1521(+)